MAIFGSGKRPNLAPIAGDKRGAMLRILIAFALLLPALAGARAQTLDAGSFRIELTHHFYFVRIGVTDIQPANVLKILFIHCQNKIKHL